MFEKEISLKNYIVPRVSGVALPYKGSYLHKISITCSLWLTRQLRVISAPLPSLLSTITEYGFHSPGCLSVQQWQSHL